MAAPPWCDSPARPELNSREAARAYAKKAFRPGVHFVAREGVRHAISDVLKRITLNPRL